MILLGGDFFRDRGGHYVELQHTGTEDKKKLGGLHMERTISVLAGRRKAKVHANRL